MSVFSYGVIIRTTNMVVDKLAMKRKNVKEKVGAVMGGKILDLDIIRIKHEADQRIAETEDILQESEVKRQESEAKQQESDAKRQELEEQYRLLKEKYEKALLELEEFKAAPV